MQTDARSIEVRRARPWDVPAILDLIDAITAEDEFFVLEHPIDRVAVAELTRARLGTDSCYLVATDAERTVGVTHLAFKADAGYLLGMGIAKEYRDRGIGSQLLERTLSWAVAKNLETIALVVYAHNARAIALYEKFGFRQTAYAPAKIRRRSGKVWDEITMALDVRSISLTDRGRGVS
jgi:ribosomal protein S18 acetylase RimI-like enzyme